MQSQILLGVKTSPAEMQKHLQVGKSVCSHCRMGGAVHNHKASNINRVAAVRDCDMLKNRAKAARR